VHIDEAGAVADKLEAVQVVDGYPASTKRMKVRRTGASSRRQGEDAGKSISWMGISNGRVRGEVTHARRRSALVETVDLDPTVKLARETSAESLGLRSS